MNELAKEYEVRAFVERVASRPGQGVRSMFTFGYSFGCCVMAVTAAGIPFRLVAPTVWQKSVNLSYPKGATATVRKNTGKRRAQQLFPTVAMTHAKADALLLAEACRREWR